MKRLLIIAAIVITLPTISLCQSASSNLLTETSIESVPLTDTLKDEQQRAQSGKQVKSDDDEQESRFWVSAEYLLWKTKRSNLPPLITTGPESGDAVIGEVGTVIALGGDKLNRGKFPGGRFTAGMWLNEKRNIGIELSYFFLKERSFNFSVSSSGQPGSQVISRPFIDAFIKDEHALLVAFPRFSESGSVTTTSPSQLQGAEANLVRQFKKDNCCRISLLAGFRYLNLNEQLNITDITDDPNGTHRTDTDQFSTRNQFYGGQVGLRSIFGRGHFNLELAGSAAIGSNRERVEINGAFSNNNIIPFNNRGGLLALMSNIGLYRRNEFTVLPEVKVKLGYNITHTVRAFIGYDFLYWDKVVRPGEQIDRVVNTNLVPSFGGPILIGPLRPAFSFKSTSFWAQGLTTGLKFRF